MRTDPLIRYPEGEELTAEKLQEYVNKYNTRLLEGPLLLPSAYLVPREDVSAARYEALVAAYENRYGIYGAPPKELWRPDVRMSANFAKYVADTFEGFFIGQPIVYGAENEDVAAYISDLNDHIEAEDLDAELSMMVAIYGRAYRIAYVDEQGDIGAANLDPTGAFGLYDESITPKMRYFVRYYTGVDGKIRGSVSDDLTVRYFEITDGTLRFTEEHYHGFGRVPCIEFCADNSRRGLFEDILPLIDAYNKALSEKANDVDAFADAYLQVLGAKLNEETLKFMRSSRVINFDGDASGLKIGFLDRPSGDQTQEHLLDRLERLVFTLCMVCNTNAESFVNASGEAMRWRMLPMINLAAKKWRKFHKGLTAFYRMVFGNPVTQMGEYAWEYITMDHVLNYPEELTDEEAEEAVAAEAEATAGAAQEDEDATLDEAEAAPAVDDQMERRAVLIVKDVYDIKRYGETYRYREGPPRVLHVRGGTIVTNRVTPDGRTVEVVRIAESRALLHDEPEKEEGPEAELPGNPPDATVIVDGRVVQGRLPPGVTVSPARRKDGDGP